MIHQHHIHGNRFPVFSPCLSSSPWVGSAPFSLCSEGKLEGGWKHAAVKNICPCFQPWRNALNTMLQQKRRGSVFDIPMYKSWYTICNHKTGKLHWWVFNMLQILSGSYKLGHTYLCVTALISKLFACTMFLFQLQLALWSNYLQNNAELLQIDQ